MRTLQASFDPPLPGVSYTLRPFHVSTPRPFDKLKDLPAPKFVELAVS